MFDEELVPEELTQMRMGKIVKDKYPELDRGGPGGGPPARHRGAELTQQAKQIALASAAEAMANRQRTRP